VIQTPVVGKAADLASGRLVSVQPQHVAAPMPVSLMYAHRKHLPKRSQAVMDWLAEVLAAALREGAAPPA
jgi:DNA-binding transcriptional LysR family regulator